MKSAGEAPRASRAMAIAGVVAVAALTPGIAPPTANAAPPSGEDSGIRFVLTREQLDLSIVPGKAAAALRKRVRGRVVNASCSPNAAGRLSARATAIWPANADKLRIVLDKDVSSRARRCLLEQVGGDDLAYTGLAPRLGRLSGKPKFGDLVALRDVFVTLRDGRNRIVSAQRQPYLDVFVKPGRYRLTFRQRRCPRRCGNGPKALVTCSRRVAIRAGRTLRPVYVISLIQDRCRISTR